MSAIVVPVPTGGWNARDSLATMPVTDAVELVNLVPAGAAMKTRPGHVAHSSALGGSVETLVTYHGATETLIACAGGKIINITAGGTGTNLGTGFTNNRWNTTEFKNRIIFCNGTNAVQDWNGTTLTATSISGATSTALIHCTTHKGRVYYIEKDSQSFWYAGAGSYAGALTEYDLSEFTTTGGDLLYMISWSRDGGSGVDDLACFVFDTGEVLVYAGSDPGSVTDWAMLGRFRIGKPLGRRSAIHIGGDVIVLTVDGYVPLSSALAEGRYSEQSDFSYKIDSAVKSAARAYGSNFGWEAVYWPNASLFLVNVPIGSAESVQHVRSTTTGAWCKFTNLDAVTFTLYGDDLYFGSPDQKVYSVRGTSDASEFIEFKCTQAFNLFNEFSAKKQITALEPITTFAYPEYIDNHIHADWSLDSLGTYDAPPEITPSQWDVAEWDVSKWVTAAQQPNTSRRNITGTGYALAHTLRFKTKTQTVLWHATNYWLNRIGTV